MANAICSECMDEVGSCDLCGHVFGIREEYECDSYGTHICIECNKG